MNLTDLKREFTRQADDAPDVDSVLAEESRRYAGRTRVRTRRALIAAAAAVALVAGGATALATALTRPTHTAGPPTPQELVHALTVAQTDDDRLTGRVRDVYDNMDPSSTRLIGESKHAKEWVAVDRQGSICLITVLPNGVIGAGCNPPEDFERSGAGVSVFGGGREGPSRSAAARVLPSDIPESSLNDAARQVRNATVGLAGWIEVFYRNSTPLIVMSPNLATDAGSITITRDDGTPFTLPLARISTQLVDRKGQANW